MILVPIVWSIYKYKNPYEVQMPYIGIFVLGFLFGTFGGMIISFILPAKTHDVTQTIYLETLSDNTGVPSGSFFLGCGTIGSKSQYSYYVKKDTAFFLESIDAKGVPIIFIEDGSRPRIEFERNQMIKEGEPGFTIWNDWASDSDEDGPKRIYVPRGTIKNAYTLDAQ